MKEFTPVRLRNAFARSGPDVNLMVESIFFNSFTDVGLVTKQVAPMIKVSSMSADREEVV